MKRTCEESSGILFRTRCDRPAEFVCSSCGISVCSEHSRKVGGQWICISCMRASIRQNHRAYPLAPEDRKGELYFHWYLEGVLEWGTQFTPEEIGVFAASSAKGERAARGLDDDWAGT